MSEKFVIHTENEIQKIRVAAAAAAKVRDQLAAMARIGMTTLELDELAGCLIAAEGGRCAFLGYYGYPGHICISLNEEVVHGIGSASRIIQADDIVSIDIGVEIDGGIGDTALTFAMKSELPSDVERLLEFTKSSLMAGIEAAVAGNYINDIGAAVEKVAKQGHLSVVKDFVGHGCGTKLHEPPEVPNYNPGGRSVKLQKGMVLAIEPMLNLGSEKVVIDKVDHWTVRTRDRSRSAHFEHMVLITDNQPEILTWPKMM